VLQPSPFDTVLYESPRVIVTRFRARPSHPQFHDSGPIRHECFVFPSTSVRIRHAGQPPFVTSPNVVSYYNRDQIYAREPVSAEGDACHCFGIELGELRAAMRIHDPSAVDRGQGPFRLTHGPCDARSYLLQRLVARHLKEAERVDPLFVEETALRLLDRMLALAVRARALPASPAAEAPGKHEPERVEAAQEILVKRFREPLTLDDIAHRVGGSVFHLARLFRRHTGFPLHAFRNQLRLRSALRVAALPGVDLTDLALDLGYSSHSHFTAAFRQAFGVTPSELRQTATSRRVRELAASIGVPAL